MPLFSFNTRVAGLFLVAVIIIGAAASGVYVSFMRIRTQQDWVDHTYTVIKDIDAVTSHLKDARAARRNYIITGQMDHLRPYHVALPLMAEKLDKLGRTVADNPVQTMHLKNLHGKIAAHLVSSEKNLDRYQKSAAQHPDKRVDDSFKQIAAASDQGQIDDIAAAALAMVRHEEQLLVERRAAVSAAIDMTIAVGGAGLGLCLAILGAVFGMVHRETARRSASEAKLQQALRQMQRISGENDMISRLGEYFQSCKTPEEAFGVIASNMRFLFPRTSGCVALFDTGPGTIAPALQWGLGERCFVDFTRDDCWALRRGRAHMVTPGGAEPCCRHTLNVPSSIRQGGALCIPMQAHGEMIGMFFICATDTAALGEHEQVLARTVAEQISLAIANLKLQEALRQQSIRDPLTRLYNRRYLDETLERELSRAAQTGQPLQLVMMDIDHFKNFNDSFGHDAGDALLSEFARLVQDHARDTDIVCRFGGEEFLALLPHTTQDEASRWARELGDIVRVLSVTHQSKALDRVTVSLGLAERVPADSAASLIARADAALYQAKHQGRDRLVTAPAVAASPAMIRKPSFAPSRAAPPGAGPQLRA